MYQSLNNKTTRTGYVSTDIGLEDTSESFGLLTTVDFMFDPYVK